MTGCNPQELWESQTVGTNARVGDVLVRNLHLAATEAAYRPGGGAMAYFALYNEARQPDALISARSEQAQRVLLRWDRACDGEAEVVDRIPLIPQGSVPVGPGQLPGGGTPYSLEIDGFKQVVRPGTTFPITLTFEQAGEVTVEAKVQPTRVGDEPPPAACPAGTSTPQPPVEGTPPPPMDGPEHDAGKEITVTGIVRAGQQPDCRLLTGEEDGRHYVLIDGDPAIVRPGATVVVRGRLEPDVPTHCAHGAVLRVINAIPR
ncbi:copper chaperone PCu(A)C [Saccharopolyspora elongata]|uniref:Copper chaperone PCu(A)C n=2 Tax=Saccharopolyspora elongata TaxID=2530387 RepID=A0A4R4ZBQ3_9PSEU|nr:copper chaperone PCu(A)C [Saccharopolyspora elongata]